MDLVTSIHLKVQVLDKCGIGAGVVAQAFTGTISETTIVYDRESDFEEYEICDPGGRSKLSSI